jgi:hypothetical protein
MSSDELTIVHSENPVNEMWSRLGYFENEYNAKEFLKKKSEELAEDELVDTARTLAFTMQAAREYYESAARVSLLTKPLLVFYGMVALSKVLFTATYSRKSRSDKHGLETPNQEDFVEELEKGHGLETPKQKDFEKDFANLSTKVLKEGTFPQFHSCYSKDKLLNMSFALKELLSTICEIKVEYETVYMEKSQAIKIQKGRYGLYLVDTELEKYMDLAKRLADCFSITSVQHTGSGLLIWNPENLPTTRALSGEEYLTLPLRKHDKNLSLPEMSAHYLIMYLLGMASRYYPKEWGEIIEGKTSGQIHIIRKFLETTTRKFPNLILNKLWSRDFIFVSPQLEREKRLDEDELERIYEYVSRKMAEGLRDLL